MMCITSRERLLRAGVHLFQLSLFCFDDRGHHVDGGATGLRGLPNPHWTLHLGEISLYCACPLRPWFDPVASGDCLHRITCSYEGKRGDSWPGKGPGKASLGKWHLGQGPKEEWELTWRTVCVCWGEHSRQTHSLCKGPVYISVLIFLGHFVDVTWWPHSHFSDFSLPWLPRQPLAWRSS